MCKGKGRESRNLHGKVRNIQPLWMVCGVKQLLMRVFRAPTHPFQAHHCRQRQLLPPCLVPHSSPGWLSLAVRPGWAFCPLLFHTINTLKLYTRHFLFEIGKQDCWVCVQIPLLTVPLSWCTKSQQCTERQSEVQEPWSGLPGTSLSLAILQLH